MALLIPVRVVLDTRILKRPVNSVQTARNLYTGIRVVLTSAYQWLVMRPDSGALSQGSPVVTPQPTMLPSIGATGRKTDMNSLSVSDREVFAED
jgi:hypothetical protein